MFPPNRHASFQIPDQTRHCIIGLILENPAKKDDATEFTIDPVMIFRLRLREAFEIFPSLPKLGASKIV